MVSRRGLVWSSFGSMMLGPAACEVAEGHRFRADVGGGAPGGGRTLPAVREFLLSCAGARLRLLLRLDALECVEFFQCVRVIVQGNASVER
jgi:hypothetical protein